VIQPAPAPPRFTVFTPTRNRRAVLHRPYQSLRAQTLRDFEWLVIDNASDDGTPEVMQGWMEEADFPIRYLYQEVNIGVQGSWRRAVEEARGSLFLFARSADTFAATALERFAFHWDAIPYGERAGFVGVTALAEDEHGRLYGTRFPRDVIDSDSLEIRHRHRVRGEKWGFQRIELLRAHLPPVIEGYTGHVPETIMWRAIARRYRTRFVNEVLRVYWADQAVSNSQPTDRSANAPGRLLAAEDHLANDLRWLRTDPIDFVREAVIYVRSSWTIGRGLRSQVAALPSMPARLLWLIGLPGGTAVHLLDRVRRWRRR
jgi:glycosyltransferase involved in cell wall biosynthesis